MAKIAVIGLGYVGLTTSVGMANLGHEVLGIDIDKAKVELLSEGTPGFYEIGLEEKLNEHLQSGRVRFTSEYGEISEDMRHFFVCVPTPSTQSGAANVDFLYASVRNLAANAFKGSIVVIKSTVPIGTCEALSKSKDSRDLKIVSNPEFLAEGNALADFMNPARIIIGAQERSLAQSVMDLLADLDAPKLICDLATAESIKHASNSLLALKLSFVNELAALCEQTGANVDEVLKGVGLDPRIGPKFLRPGPGWGGSCFPKDSSELAHSARVLGAPMSTVEAAIISNAASLERVVQAVMSQLDGQVRGKTISIWGLAFKANTDDTRESPAVEIARRLVLEGAKIQAYDPMASNPDTDVISLKHSALEACLGSDALVVLTEWEEFRTISPESVKEVMNSSAVVYDARRILVADKWRTVFPAFKSLGTK